MRSISWGANLKGQWITPPNANVSVIFVHGVLSDGNSCWTNQNGCYWPKLLADESGLEPLGIYVFTYHTGFFRRWEQGEDPSMLDSDIFIYEKRTKIVIADPSERKKFAAIGLRRLARESKLSLAPVGKVIKGEGVRPQTLSIIRQTAARIPAE